MNLTKYNKSKNNTSKNKTKKNFNKKNSIPKTISWDNLQKNECKFINKNTKNKNFMKVKKIALEEAIIWPSQTEDVDEGSPLEYLINTGKGFNKYNKLLDITDLRLKIMQENNISMQIISPTASGIQNLKFRPIKHQYQKAIEINNYMYDSIKNYPKYFNSFCTLPMRDPTLASKELKRCIIDLKMVGALINGLDIIYKEPMSSTFPNRYPVFYDKKNYDILWKTFEELDVPLYIHPTVYNTINRDNPDSTMLNFYDEYPQLPGSAWGFSINLAQHILRLVLSGVFDRFPKFKLIIGHMGEALPWWAERFDHRMCIWKNEVKLISKKDFKKFSQPEFIFPKLPLMEYFKRNIFITTSGWFSDDALQYCIKKLGVDRILFSIDYPYEDQKIASDWLDNVDLNKEDKEKIAYKNAAKLLKLDI